MLHICELCLHMLQIYVSITLMVNGDYLVPRLFHDVLCLNYLWSPDIYLLMSLVAFSCVLLFPIDSTSRKVAPFTII